MGGFSSVTGLETIVNADNASFDGTSRGGAMTTNGELWIGSTAAPHVRKGNITSTGGTITVTNNSGNINLEAGGNITLTGDSGGALSPTAGNFDVLGQQAGTVAVMDTIGSVSTLRIENRTWRSQYVVDASSTDGLRGTFTTIPAAITQAFADHPTSNSTIFIRPGTYADNISVPAGAQIHLTSDSFYSDQNSNTSPVIISGTITCASACDFSASNILINGTCTFSAIGGYAFDRVSFGIINISGVANSISLALDCTFSTINHSATGISRLEGCQWGATNISAGTMQFKNCYELSNVTMSGSGSFKAENCTWVISGGAARGVIGSTSGTVELVNCKTNVADISSGTFSYAGLTQVDPLFSGFRSSASTGTYLYLPSNQGSVKDVTKTAISLTITKNMQYVGVTSTAAPRTMTLPDTSSASLKPFFGQSWTFKDESGGAAANNITISPNGGNIEGAASFVINTNYGSAEVIFDGTNYFVI